MNILDLRSGVVVGGMRVELWRAPQFCPEPRAHKSGENRFVQKQVFHQG